MLPHAKLCPCSIPLSCVLLLACRSPVRALNSVLYFGKASTVVFRVDYDVQGCFAKLQALKLLGALHPISETMVDMAVTMLQLGVVQLDQANE